MSSEAITTRAGRRLGLTYLRRLLGSDDTADDVVQIVSEKVLRSNRTPGAAYLRQMFKNAAIDHVRSETTRQRYEDRFALEAESVAANTPESCATSAAALEAAALSAFRGRSMQHEAEVQKAERFLDLSGRLKRPRQTLRRRMRFQLSLRWQQFLQSGLAFSATAAVVLGVAMLVFLLRQSRVEPPQPLQAAAVPAAPTTYKTRWRQQREVRLTDGSVVWLDWDTELQTEFTGTQRLVTLAKGGAAFKVTADLERPFVVVTRNVRTRVTGTEFVVRRQGGDRVEVAVLEGQVQVQVKAQAAVLGAAQAVRFSGGELGERFHRSREEMASWREGILVFSDRPLLDAIAELAPYSRFDVDVSAISGHRGLVSGTFFVEQADEALITILKSHRLSAESHGNRLKVRYARLTRP